jgi:hypothetical protein
MEDVVHYFRRKGILNLENAALNPPASMPPSIECWTPLSSPSLRADLSGEDTNSQSDTNLLTPQDSDLSTLNMETLRPEPVARGRQSLSIDRCRQILFSNPAIPSFEIPCSPLPLQDMLELEKLFASIRVYYTGSFDSGVFVTDDKGYLINIYSPEGFSKLDEFYNLCAVAVSLVEKKHFIEGRRLLSKASDLLKCILLEQAPQALQILLDSFWYLKSHEHPELSRIFVTLAHSLAVTMFNQEHPLAQTFLRLTTMEESKIQFAMKEAWKCIYDLFANSVGQFHVTSIYCYMNFVDRFYRMTDAPRLLKNLLERAEQKVDKSGPCIPSVRHAYGQALYYHQRNSEVVVLMNEVIQSCRKHGTLVDLQELEIFALNLLACCQVEVGLKEAALRESIGRCEAVRGTQAITTLKLKGHLQGYLREWGRDAEADVLEQEIHEAIDLDMSDLVTL